MVSREVFLEDVSRVYGNGYLIPNSLQTVDGIESNAIAALGPFMLRGIMSIEGAVNPSAAVVPGSLSSLLQNLTSVPLHCETVRLHGIVY